MKCPFCETASAVLDRYEHPRKPVEHFVRCNGCGALGSSHASPEQALERWSYVVSAVESQHPNLTADLGSCDAPEVPKTLIAITVSDGEQSTKPLMAGTNHSER
jgi:hypothetical protein